MTNTRKLIGAAAFTVALAGGGIAGALLGSPVTSGAQESTTTTADDGDGSTEVHAGRRGPGLEAAATALGMTAEELRAQLEAGQTIAEVAAAEGVDVDTVIDAMVAEATEDIRERITAVVNGEAPLGRRGHRGFGAKLETLTTVLGVTAEELHDALESGQSIADVAAAEGVDVQTVIDALVEEGVPAERAEEIVNHEGTFERHRRGPRP
ncbi:MAG TPA: hypothetical protein VFU93_01495 [Acidimicrobiales bacterium]|nr:hypothetical protein [Acidimicrobiales bacterium]